MTAPPKDADAHVLSLAHGVLVLEQLAPEYGGERRRLNVRKVRGTTYRGGNHDYVIKKGGLKVFPRLVAAEHHRQFPEREHLQRRRGHGHVARRRTGARDEHAFLWPARLRKIEPWP